jgi:hydroxymethylpyrimidine/phosphomethylpyrimidine kinase
MEIDCVKRALNILKKSSDFSRLIPEVRTNLVMAQPKAKDPEEVVGIPGRITVIKGIPVSCAEPAYGASSHMARLIIEIMSYDPIKKSAINIKYHPKLIDICQKLGLKVSFYDRNEEPKRIKKMEGKTIPWGVQSAIKRVGTVPDVIYHKGAWGKEPSLVLIGENAEEVAKMAVCISKLFAAI